VDNHILYKWLRSRGSFPEEDFPHFLALWKPEIFPKNHHLLTAGNIARFTVFVLKGCLRQYTVNEEGHEHIIFFAEEEWFAGDLQSMRTQTPSQLNLQALEECEVLTITRENWEFAFNNFPWWQKMHLDGHHRWVAKLQQQVSSSMTDSAETKYLRLLRDRPKLLQRIPQYYIAAFLGISPEALSRIRKKIFNF
jgi:CRP-like cAMP-binding protein